MARPADLKKRALVAALVAARARISATGAALHRSFDGPARAAENPARRRPLWLSGAAMLGLALSKLPARQKAAFLEKTAGKLLGAAGKFGPAGKIGALFSLVKIVVSVARPLLSQMRPGALAGFLQRFRRRPDKPAAPGKSGPR